MLTSEARCLDIAISAFAAAHHESKEFKSTHPANHGFIRTFWQCYIERNLSRASYLKGNRRDGKRFAVSAEKKRRSVIAQLKTARVPILAKQFELELGLSKFDQEVNGRVTEDGLASIVDEFIAPHVPRGVDRVWDRLFTATVREADARGYENLSKRLRSIAPSHLPEDQG